MHGCSLGFTSAIALVELPVPGFEPHEIETRSIINPRPPQRDSPIWRCQLSINLPPHPVLTLIVDCGARLSITDTPAHSRASAACSPHIASTLFSRRSLDRKRVPSCLLHPSASGATALTPRTTTAADDRRRIAPKTSDSRTASSSKPTARAAAAAAAAAGVRAGTMDAAATRVFRKVQMSHTHRQLPCLHPQTHSH